MEWEAPAIVLRSEVQGETSLLVTVLTQTHGVWKGLVKGGNSSRQCPLWQTGNILMVKWQARLAEQLGHFTGEIVKTISGYLLDYPRSLALMMSACAVCANGLPEKEPYPDLFNGLVRILNALTVFPSTPPFADYIRWESLLLEQLGYGLDLSCCTVTGQVGPLAYISPRTGKAVSEEGAGKWKDRLLPLPSLLLHADEDGSETEWQQGLKITGYFLEKSVFGVLHRPLPAARERLLKQFCH
ncbi:DNA repair protein RecO [Acetobacteraceae bacterium ESL0709]|nr:DNA repair protein RecO [Acetobacteraceae bacterium ESL0697]MDF7677868.1 DNA repair protein RecO [Acetobacteraceae bacterium ESL0709]